MIDIPPSKRGLGWGWCLGWSNHPKDIAAHKRIEAEGWHAVTQTAPITRTAPQNAVAAKRAPKARPCLS